MAQTKHVTTIYKELFRSNGLPKMRSNLGERCPVSGPENTYLSPRSETRRRSAGQRQDNDRGNSQRQLNYKVITIVQCKCKSDSSLKTRYILTKRSYSSRGIPTMLQYVLHRCTYVKGQAWKVNLTNDIRAELE
jgi:hypothetical protein